MADIQCYEDVWLEAQNQQQLKWLRSNLADGDTARVTVQPGDMTMYLFSLTPILATYDFKVSDDGREAPADAPYVDRPFGLIATVLNEDFAERSGHFWAHEIPDLDVTQVARRIGSRNVCTAHALMETIKAACGI